MLETANHEKGYVMIKQSLRAFIARVKHSRVPSCVVVVAVIATIIIISLSVLHAIEALNFGQNAQVIAPAATKPAQTSNSSAMQGTPPAKSPRQLSHP